MTVRFVGGVGLPATTSARLALARKLAKKHSAFAVLWTDGGSDLLLYVTTEKGDRVLVRRVRADTTDRYEALALVARSTVKALLSGGAIDVAPARLPTSRPATHTRNVRGRPSEPRSSRPGIRLGLELGYAFDLFSDEALDTHAVELGATLWLHRRWALTLRGRALATASSASDHARLTLRRLPISVGARLLLVGGRRLRLALDGALGVEHVSADTAGLGGLHASTDADAAVFFGAVALQLTVRLARKLRLFARLAATIPIDRERYVVALPNGDQPVVLAPWRIQPGLRVGVATDLL